MVNFTLRGRRIFVTGAAGFIGANLVRRLLDEGALIFAPVRDRTSLWRLEDVMDDIDLMLLDLVDLAKTANVVGSIEPHYIFHLAVARDSKNWKRTFETNVTAAINLVQCAKSSSLLRFIHLGSSMEYGPSELPLQEQSLLRPGNFYGACKAAASIFALQSAVSEGCPAVVLRPFHVYGPWEPRSRLIPKAILAIGRNEELPLTQPGFRHDLVFVEDVMDACILAATIPEIEGEAFNIATGRQRSNEEVVAEIGSILQRKPIIRHGAFPAREWDTDNWVADVTHASQKLGWSPRHSLRDGLKKTVEWVRANYD